MDFDVAILGAGIVGMSTAIHLQRRGRTVVLIDRSDIGAGASYGNAGLIERSAVVPFGFPRSLWVLARMATNRSAEVRYDPLHLIRILPWLFSYWKNSAPARLIAASKALLPLVERSVSEHRALMAEAGQESLYRFDGWIDLYRSPRRWQAALGEAAKFRDEYGLQCDTLDWELVCSRVPRMGRRIIGGIRWKDSASVLDPGLVLNRFAELARQRGATFARGDARSITQDGGRWRIQTQAGGVAAKDVVLALGAWSRDVTRKLGYRLPLQVKRGYHAHFSVPLLDMPHQPVIDVERGYVLSPMLRGLRLTSGVEFAARDAPDSPIQLDRAERAAREVFPLGRRIEERPWMGHRPCLPDMLPILGPAPRHKGLWFAFGHAHHGFTLGPASGRLIAELMTGTPSFADPTPFRADRTFS